ncbi:coiled-coil domain-containing protein [Patescibacteria group bacterium]
MKVNISFRKFITTTLITLLAVLSILTIFPIYNSDQKVNASNDLYEDLKKIEEELAEIKRQKEDLNNKISGEKNLQNSLSTQIYNLANSISQLELDIKEKELDIEKKETEIKILEEDITEAKQQIDGIEKDVGVLEDTANDILKTIYVESKTNSLVDILLTAKESTSFISQIQYHTALGAHDQNTLENLQLESQKLEEQKKQMEGDKTEVEKLAEQIKEQKEDLEKDRESLSAQRNQKNQLLQDSKVAAAYYGSQYENLSDAEMKKEAELDFILQQIVTSATKPKGYAVKGQAIATEGNNGCSTGPHTHFGLAIDVGTYIDSNDWVDPCGYFPHRSFWWGTCSGNGSIRYPYNDPFYSSRGFVWYHKGIDIIAGTNKLVYASHDGYYFEETAPCSNSWCSVGCKGPTNPCVKVCESVDCTTGKVSIYCHVNFL